MQDRRPDDLQLRLQRRADRGGAAGQRRLSPGQADRLGRQGTCKATGEPEAEKFIRKEYRKPWTL